MSPWRKRLGTSRSSNAATITGSGSSWRNSGDLVVSYRGTNSTLVITNGGAAFDVNGYIGQVPDAFNNSATVTGPGSLWQNSGNLWIGRCGVSNTLTVADGGAVTVGNELTIGALTATDGNAVRMDGGQLVVTNGAIVLGSEGPGRLDISGGTVLARQVFATNGANSLLNMAGGTLAADVITNGGGANVILTGGTFRPLDANGDWPAAMAVSNTVTLDTVDAGGQARTSVLSGAVSGGGTLNVTGNGTLRFNCRFPTRQSRNPLRRSSRCSRAERS